MLLRIPGGWWFLGLAMNLATAANLPAQQPTPHELAVQLLDAGRRAYNEKNLPFAADKFRQFLKDYGGHRDAHHARLGLGLAILESPTPDYQQAIDQLKPAAGAVDFLQRPLASYYLGTAQRALGHAALVQAATAQAANNAGEVAKQQGIAKQQLEQALAAFDTAASGFAAYQKEPIPPDPALLPSDLEWVIRARLDQAEMLLRLGKTPEALAVVEKVLAEKTTPRSKYFGLAQYYKGYALFAGGKQVEAARTLSQLAPFQDRAYGAHARYMLARTHHLLGEQPEAARHYEAILAAYDEEAKLAEQVKKNAELLKGEPAERARLLLVTAAPPPDYVARSWFYAGVLAYEKELFSDALERFNQFATRYKTSPLVAEAQLRKGFCQVRLSQFQEATQTLTPLADQPQLGDQARWWLGRAYVGLAKATPAAFAGNIKPAQDHLKVAADRAGALAAQDPTAKQRRHDILVELGDAFQQNKQFNEAAAVFQQILNETPDPERNELALQRLTAALHLAGKYKESDDACVKFAATFPKSLLLGAVQFRRCENALAVAEAAHTDPKTPNREATLKPLYTEVLTRTEKYLQTYPESPEINLVRHAAGLSQYRLGQFDKAAGLFQTIAAPDRSGDLASVPYLLADCLLRMSPETAEDALAAGSLLEQAGEVVKLLDGFIAANATSPHVGDAMLKLGDAQQRIAGVLSEPKEKAATLQLARQAYEKVMQQFPAPQPVHALAVYERARCILAQNDLGSALNEYKRFESDPLKGSPIAPMAILRYATLLRQQKKPQDAIAPLATARQQHEAALIADPQRAAWAPLLQYHHGLVLREAGKLLEAQQLFENLVQRFANSPEAADAVWRAQQCKRDQLVLKLEPARVTLARPDAPAAEAQAARAVVTDTIQQVTAIAAALEAHATALSAKAKGSEAQFSTQYEAAWCYRLLAQFEVAAARDKLREAAQKVRQDELTRATPMGRTPAKAALPDVPLTQVPLQPAEVKSRALYTAMITGGGESRLVPVAQLELAELHAQREEFEPGIKLLETALNAAPADEALAERLRVRLAACYLGLGDGGNALVEVDALAKNDKGPLWAESRFLAGEALSQQKKYAEAVEMLKLFRDDGRLHNIAGVSDRAMLRLAYAYEQLNQWDPARQAYEALFNRYPQSPWRVEARYGMGWCLQKMQQWDASVNQYAEVVKSTTQEVAARAQYNIGTCRHTQQRFKEAADAFQLCAYTYDYPELSAQALVDAATSLEAMKMVPDAKLLLAQVGKEFPSSKVAPVAAERLQKLSAAQ